MQKRPYFPEDYGNRRDARRQLLCAACYALLASPDQPRTADDMFVGECGRCGKANVPLIYWRPEDKRLKL